MEKSDTQFIASYDNTPFFEKALKYGVEHAIITEEKIAEIITDAAAGTIQIAEYFGESAHLRKILETSKQRMVSLVSLHLESSSDGMLDRAALMLKEKSFRTLSRGGSQMLKALYNLPEENHFGSVRLDSEREFLKKSLSKKLSTVKYQQTFQNGERFKQDINLATLLIKIIGGSIKPFHALYAPADHVVRTAILVLAYGAKKTFANQAHFPDEAGLLEIFTSIRKEYSFLGDVTCSTKFLEQLPEVLHRQAKDILSSIRNEDIPKVVSASVTLESVFNTLKNQRYFYIYDALSAIGSFDQATSTDWFAITGGADDDASLLTLLLCAAAGLEQKTLLKISEAKKVVLSIREHDILDKEVNALIQKAPHHEIAQLESLWSDFIEEAKPYLRDHTDVKLSQVMMYLDGRCNIQKVKK